MDRTLTDIVGELLERERGRVYGKHRGLVRDIADPLAKGRIRAEVPTVFGTEQTPWAMPCLPFAGPGHGLALLPEVGDGVWIEFEAGDPARPIWSGCWWADGERPDPAGDTVRLLATSGGHRIVLDEAADEVRLVHPGGAEVVLGRQEIVVRLGACSIRLSATEIDLNNGMVKVTTAGASLVNDAFKVGV